MFRNDTARFGKILDRREREKEKVRDEFERLASKEEGKRHSFPLEDTINVQTIGQEGTNFQENEINLGRTVFDLEKRLPVVSTLLYTNSSTGK